MKPIPFLEVIPDQFARVLAQPKLCLRDVSEPEVKKEFDEKG